LHEIPLMSNRVIVEQAKDIIPVLFIKGLCLETVRFKPGVMAIPLASFILSSSQKLASNSLMTSSLYDRKPIKIHPAARKNNVNTSKHTILCVADKDAQTLGTPDINMGIIIRTDNRENGINISRWWVLDDGQVVIGQVLAHASLLLWHSLMTSPAYTNDAVRRSGKRRMFNTLAVIASYSIGLRHGFKVRPNGLRISRRQGAPQGKASKKAQSRAPKAVVLHARVRPQPM